jgi:hypothetical protein
MTSNTGKYTDWIGLLLGFLILGAVYWFMWHTGVGNLLINLAAVGFGAYVLWQVVLRFFTDLKPEMRWWLLVASIAAAFFTWLFVHPH